MTSHITLKALATTIALASLSQISVAQAAQVEVEFDESKRYTDVRPGMGRSKKSYKEDVFASITKYFVEHGEKLPKDQKLNIKVTNIDLAGETRYSSIHDVRVVKDIYFPRLEFKYELKDASDKTVTSGDANIKDMNFMRRSSFRNSSSHLPAEENLIKDWYKETFAEK